MRNLKKVLSLVLALAMVLSICMVGAGAVNYDDFTDEGEITKKQAVETLVSLDVIKGYNDGATFNPTGNVTRAEMATMICRVLAGGDKMIPDATKPVPTYNDVRNNPSAAWAETYIEYCTSLGIVSGKGNGIFDPMANVTAAEAAKMVMTALGYNADIEGFKGIGWDINTMAKASTLKLTDNLVGEISANAPMTRQQVAQLLFNALDDPMVQYYEGNNANVWIGAGNVNDKYYETLLETKFNAEKVVGVVVANEYADLADTEPLAAGRTRVIVLGTDNEPVSPRRELTVNLSTNLDKIGESIIVYRDKASNRIIFGDYQDTGLNKVTEFTDKKEDITKGDGAVDKSARTAEQYVNFAEGVYSVYTASRTFTYSYVPTEGAEVVKVNVRKGDVLGENSILSYGDLEWVYDAVNTDRTNEVVGFIPDNDSENKMPKLTNAENENYANFEEWAATYLTVKDLKNGLNALENENGNYIKVVDYNSDGEIDYVLKTVYTASTVQRVSKDDEITLTNYETKGTINYIERDDKNADKIPVTEIEVVGDMPVAGDVVLYKVIDGTAYMQIAEMTTKKIDNVRRNTVTVETKDGDTYTQSGVNMIFRQDPMDDLVGTAEGSADQRLSITQMRGNETYDIFFDLYGHIVAYRTAVNVGQYVLLTDGWYAQWKNNEEWSVKAYVDGKIDIFDLANNRSSFIDDNHNTSNTNDWSRLRTFWNWETGDDANTDKVMTADQNLTNIASYSEDDDGKWTLTPVDTLNKTRKTRVIDLYNVWNEDDSGVNTTKIENEIDGNKYLIGTAYDTLTPDSKDGHGVYNHTTGVLNTNDRSYHNVTVRPRTDTVYYYVYRNDKGGIDGVTMYNGYREAPKVKYENINYMYAVATEYMAGTGVNAVSEYYIANVIVVELDKTYSNGEPVFLIDGPDIVTNVSDDIYTVIRKDGKVEDIRIEKGNEVADAPAAPKAFPIGKATGVDYGTSFLHGYTSSGWGNGLYMLFETRKEGVYSVRPMTTKEMKDNGFTIGIVAVYGGIYDGEYTAVHSVTGDELDGGTEKIPVGIDQKMADAYAAANAKPTRVEAIDHVENVLNQICRDFKKDEEIRPNGATRGSYYTLDYTYDALNKNPGDGNYHWNLRLNDDASYEEVMYDSFELNNGYVSYNMVLVKAEKNGDVVYAVNFEQERDYNRDDVMDKNLAVELWRSLVDRFNEPATSNKDKIEKAKEILNKADATAEQVAEQIESLKDLKEDKDLSYKDGAEIDEVLDGLELKLAQLEGVAMVNAWAEELRKTAGLTEADENGKTKAAVDALITTINKCATADGVKAIIAAPETEPAEGELSAYTGIGVLSVLNGVAEDIVNQYVVSKEADPKADAVKTVIGKIMTDVKALEDAAEDGKVNAEAVFDKLKLEDGVLTVPGTSAGAAKSDLDIAIAGATAYTMTIAAGALAGTTNATGGTSNKLTVWQDVDGLRIKLVGPINNEKTTVYLTNTDTTNDLVYVLTLKDTSDGNKVVWTSDDISVPKSANGVDGKSDPVVITLPKAATTYALSGEIKSTTGAKVTLTLADHGTIKLNGTTTIANGGTDIENLMPGDTVKFTVEPAEGYEVQHVKDGNNVELKPNADDGMYTFTKNNTGSAETVTVTVQTIAAGKVAEAKTKLNNFKPEITPHTGDSAPTADSVKNTIIAQVKAKVEGAARVADGYSYEVTSGVDDSALSGLNEENTGVKLANVVVTITYTDGELNANDTVTLTNVPVYWLFKDAEVATKLAALGTAELAKITGVKAGTDDAKFTALKTAAEEKLAAIKDPTTETEKATVENVVLAQASNTGDSANEGKVTVTYDVVYNGKTYTGLTGEITIAAADPA